jgi:hypothetical protein
MSDVEGPNLLGYDIVLFGTTHSAVQHHTSEVKSSATAM